MRTIKLIFGFAVVATLLTSCYTEVIVEDDYNDPVTVVTLNQVLNSYELWYVDIHRSSGSGYVPFVSKAFTLSFRNGTLFANNNLVGIGEQGYGFGIDVGIYDTYGFNLEITHDIDGYNLFEVRERNATEIELYNRANNVRYVLVGYQRNTFDYDMLFYDNIHYFVQEYVAWEKTFTSLEGELNEFDYEHFLAFLPGGGDGNFKSSQDPQGTYIYDLYWDYTGIYNVDDVPGDGYLKYLTLDYDFLGNEYFELSVLSDNRIELYHPSSGTFYEFTGRGYIPFKNKKDGKLRISNSEIQKTMKKISIF